MKSMSDLRSVLCLSLCLPWLTVAKGVEYPCHRLPAAPVVDGRGDEEAWRHVPSSSGFYVLGGRTLAGDKQTSFKAGWTADSLFLLVRCEEPAPGGLKGGAEDGGKMWSDDSIELFFVHVVAGDLFNFVANCRGARWNGMGAGEAKPLWDWTAKTTVEQTSWTLEVKIPFAVLLRAPAAGEQWEVNIARNIMTGGDRYTCWPPLKKGFRDLPDYGSFLFRDSVLPVAESAAIEKELTAPTLAFLRDYRLQHFKSEVAEPVAQLAEEYGTLVARDRHPAFPGLRRRLADVKSRSHAILRGLERSGELPAAAWTDLQQQGHHLSAELTELGSQLALVRLYPAEAGEKELPFVLGTAGDQPWMDETALSRCALQGPIRISLLGGETESFRVWVIPFWRELRDVIVAVAEFRGPGGNTLPEDTLRPAVPAAKWSIASGEIGLLRIEAVIPAGTPPGVYRTALTVTADGHSAARPVEIRVRAGRILNNFAAVLAECSRFSSRDRQTFSFDNPRDGWVHVAVSGEIKNSEDVIWLGIDSEDEKQAVVRLAAEGPGAGETMRKLPPGRHEICLGLKGNPGVNRLTVRAVPEIICASYRYDSRIGKQFGVFDWEFLNRHVLPHINTLNGPRGLSPELIAKHAAEWHSRGGRCIQDTSLPNLGGTKPMPTVEETCTTLAKALALPHLDAILADECIRRYVDKNLVYAEAFRRLAAMPQFKDKTVYPYIAGSSPGGKKATDFLRRVAELRSPMALEYYCTEKRTLEEAGKHIAEHADSYLKSLREIMDEPQRRSIFVLFYCCLSPCSANVIPYVDFKVFLDMQMHYLANQPGLCGIYGVECYTSGYTDEETLRWMSRLFRHYCIEGRRERLTTDPYILPHIRNADFTDGLEHWEVTMAEADSVKPMKVREFSKWMGYWPSIPPGGDDCLWLKRSQKGPNRISQKIRGLEPGRVYSLKFFTHDMTNPHVKRKHALSVAMEGVEILDDRSFQAVFPGKLSWSKKKDEEYNWLNCHYRRFRAKSDTARLTVSDWAAAAAPGGAEGRELLLDFVEVQPYFAGEGDLVAHYTFDELNGTVLRDLSGNGNHGQIKGATRVASPRGHALRFDGIDDYVDLGCKPSLQISGDLTIEARIKTDYQDTPATGKYKKHRLIVGTDGPLGINRNYNLRIDHRDNFVLEWADNITNHSIGTEASFLDGKWQHVAVVLESGEHYYVYVNGRLKYHESVADPIPKPTPFDFHIGGWQYGFFKGEIDEIRIYKRAISTAEIRTSSSGKPGAGKPELEVRGGYSHHRKAFSCNLFCTAGAHEDLSVVCRVLAPVTNEAVASARIPLRETRKGTGRWVSHTSLAAELVRPGDYRFEATVVDSKGRTLAKNDVMIPYLPRPDWFDAEIGITDEVLPPYTPCEVKKQGDAWQVRTWGRRHTFDPAPFLSGIDSANAQLFSGPVRFVAMADSKRLSWAPNPPELRQNSPTEVRLQQTLQGDETRLIIDTQLEYDGFMKVNWCIEARQPISLDQLAVEFPLDRRYAKLFHCWPVAHSGELKKDWAGVFKPIVWLGDEERGLCWVAESERNWSLIDPHKAIEVLRGAETVALKLNLVTKKTRLKRGEKLDYTFGLQATPVRPMDTTYWDSRVVRNPPYAHEYQWPDRKIQGRSSLEFYADQGVRALLVLRWWDAFSYPLPLGHEKRFPELVKAVHQHDLKVVPYAIGFLLSEETPEYKYFREDMLAVPKRPYPIDRLPGLPKQMTYYACTKGAWQDFCVAATARCMDKYDTDGVYLDTTVRPHACANRSHGCGYVKADGTIGSTYPVFAVRQLMKRLYTVVKSRKPDGFVDAHVYDCLNVPALAFATGYWNGEQLTHHKFKPDALPLDRFRTEFMGHNIGIPADVLYYRMHDYDAAVALAIIHDVPVRSENDRDLAILSSIWRVREAFDCREAEFVGYWKNSAFVTATPTGARVSLWRHPKNGVLAAVSNLTRKDAKVRLTFNLRNLGLPAKVAANDARTNTPCRVAGNQITVDLKAQAWTLIRIRPDA